MLNGHNGRMPFARGERITAMGSEVGDCFWHSRQCIRIFYLTIESSLLPSMAGLQLSGSFLVGR